MNVITNAKHFKQKAACSFIHEQKEILFKEKQNSDRWKDGDIMLSKEEIQSQIICHLLGS